MNDTEQSMVWHPAKPFPGFLDLPLPDRVEHRVLHRGDVAWKHLHEPSLVRHGNRFYAAWNHSPALESEQGSVIRWVAMANDLCAMGAPQPMAPALTERNATWESVQLFSTGGELWAFVGQVHTQPRRAEQSGGRMACFQFDEQALEWKQRSAVEGFHPIHRPQALAGGGWIMGGQFSMDEPRVALCAGADFRRWDVVPIPCKAQDQVRNAETSLFVDGTHVYAHVRTGHERLYVAESSNGGRHWAPLSPSNLPMSPAKTCAGRLSTGQRFLVFNMLPSRDTLAMAVSAPNALPLEKIVRLRSGPSPASRYHGKEKCREWSYASVEEHEGKVYICYSVTKEDCAVTILPLESFTVP